MQGTYLMPAACCARRRRRRREVYLQPSRCKLYTCAKVVSILVKHHSSVFQASLKKCLAMTCIMGAVPAKLCISRFLQGFLPGYQTMSQQFDARTDQALWVQVPYRQLVHSAAVSSEFAKHRGNSPLGSTALHMTTQACGQCRLLCCSLGPCQILTKFCMLVGMSSLQTA